MRIIIALIILLSLSGCYYGAVDNGKVDVWYKIGDHWYYNATTGDSVLVYP